MSPSLAASPLIANAETAKPDATLELSGKTVAVGVGFTEATGTLHYQGQSYRVQVQGLSLAQAGGSNIEATGEVYHLNRLQDVRGNCVAALAGAAVVDGHTETTMNNQNGVVIKLHANTDGVTFAFRSMASRSSLRNRAVASCGEVQSPQRGPEAILLPVS